MKSFNLNIYTIILISFIIIFFSFTVINSQEIKDDEELKRLFSNSLSMLNKTEIKYLDISEKMKNIKYNIFLKVRYKNLKRKHKKINAMISSIKGKIDINKYDLKEINEDMYKLDVEIENFGKKCEKAIKVFNRAEQTKKIFMNIIKAFFFTLIIVIVVVMIIIGIVSIIIIKRQKKYHALDEELSNSNIEINVGNNYNKSFDEIKEKDEKEKQNIKSLKKRKIDKKKKSGHQSQKSENTEINE